MKFFAGVVTFAVIFTVVQSSSDYSYSSQYLWPGECTTGRRQSPINILTNSLQCSAYLKPLLLNHQYYTPMSGTWENKGHTVQFTPQADTNAYMLTSIGTYRLVQFHMHWGVNAGSGSEHYVDNYPADFEVHFVHQKVGAVDETDCDYYAVLGVRGYSYSTYASLTGIFSQLAVNNIEYYGYQVYVTNVDLSSLLPTGASLDYYHYQGSLTTPDCNERVQWFLLKQAIAVPQVYLESLRKIRDKNGYAVTFNYRLYQNNNGRIVTQVSLEYSLLHAIL